MTNAKRPSARAAAVLELLRHDHDHDGLNTRIRLEVLRLRGEGQNELADELAAVVEDGAQ